MMIGTDKPSLGELAHFGVKGMKWGVRRNRETKTGKKKPRRLSSLMSVKDDDPRADRIRRVSEAQDRVNKAETVAAYNRALKNLETVQRQIRIEEGKKTAKKVLTKHGSSRLS